MQRRNIQHGVLVTNAFLRTNKFVEHYEWLAEAAKQYDIRLDLWDNTHVLTDFGDVSSGLPESVDFVIFWDKDIPLATKLYQECLQRDIPMYNRPEAIALCDDKCRTYQALAACQEYSFSLIPTIVAPMTYQGIGYGDAAFVDRVIERLSLPLVIKECFGSFGQQVYLARSREEVMEYTHRLAGVPFLYQKYMKPSHGVDVRLQVVGDQVVAAMKRRSVTEDFRANLSNGGSMERYEPSAAECEIAVQAAKALGLSFAGVDLLFAKGESHPATVVCEVNSNAHFRNIAECTGVNTAQCIMEMIVQEAESRGTK